MEDVPLAKYLLRPNGRESTLEGTLPIMPSHGGGGVGEGRPTGGDRKGENTGCEEKWKNSQQKRIILSAIGTGEIQ